MSNFYFKTRKRMIAWICAITMVVAGLTVVPKTVAADDTASEKEATAVDWSSITDWTKIDKTDLSYSITQKKEMFDKINAWGDPFFIVVKRGGFKATITGPTSTDKVEIECSGAEIKLEMKYFPKSGYYTIDTTGLDGFQIAIKRGSSSTGGETEKPEGTKPIMGTGVEIKILSEKTLYIAGLNTIEKATSFELYQDGEFLRKVENGDNIPLSELTPGKHEYYVKGVNDYGKSEPSKTFEIVIPEVKASKDIIVDNGTPETVEEDSEYKFGDAKYGYYDINKNVIYKAGSTIKVKDNMHLVSINDIRLSFTNGAAIRIEAGVPTPGGIRFQAKLDVTCGVAEYKNAIINALQAGTMITTKDILEKSGKDYTVENIKEIGTVLNVENKNGWKDADTHTFNASLINIVEANYTRYFVAKAYVKVPYANDVPAEYVYSENDANSAVQVERSISDIAKTIQSNNYDGETNEDIKSLINSFIKK